MHAESVSEFEPKLLPSGMLTLSVTQDHVTVSFGEPFCEEQRADVDGYDYVAVVSIPHKSPTRGGPGVYDWGSVLVEAYQAHAPTAT